MWAEEEGLLGSVPSFPKKIRNDKRLYITGVKGDIVKQMIRRIFFIFGLCSLLFIPVIAAAVEVTTREHQVTTAASSYDTLPSLGRDATGPYAVYASRAVQSTGYGPGRIWMQRLTEDGAPSGSPVIVSTGGTDDQLNDCDGKYIVYTAYDSQTVLSGRIILYNIESGSAAVLASASAVRETRISGNNVVWVQGATSAAMIMLFDLADLGTGGGAKIIAGPSPSATNPDIGDRFVVWDELSNGQRDIHSYDLLTGAKTTVGSDPVNDEWLAATSGPWVVWETRTPGLAATQIEAVNMDTHERRVIADNGTASYAPTISGDYITYESRAAGNFDIYLYRLSTRETYKLTSNPVDQRLNNINGNMVVYVDLRAGNMDVYVSKFTFNSPPAANAGPDQIVEANSSAGASVTLNGAGSTDPEGTISSYSWAGTFGTISGATASVALPLGTHTITLTITDEGGLTSEDTVQVIIRDTLPPVMNLPGPITVEATSPAGAVVTYGVTSSDAVNGPINPVCSPASGSRFPLGTTTVSCSAADFSGNAAAGSFSVTVQDTTAPTLNLWTHLNVEAQYRDESGNLRAVVNYEPYISAWDAVSGALTPSCTPSSGSALPGGLTVVECFARDARGNISRGSFEVYVADTAAPELHVPASITTEATGADGAVVKYSVIAKDADGLITPVCTPSSGSIFPLGDTKAVCTATDLAGNSISLSFPVTVVDTTPPVLTLPADFTLPAADSTGATVAYSASAVDLVDGARVKFACSPPSGDLFPNGKTVVSCFAADSRGNTSKGGFSVTIIPNTPPTANAGLGQTVHAGNPVTLDGSGSSDPDGNVPLTYSWSLQIKPSGSSASLSGATAVNPTLTPDLPGDYVIELVVTDSLGTPSVPVAVTISTVNTAPIADAGPDQAVTLIGSTVQLNGSRSYDLDGDTITSRWAFISIPAGSVATLSNADTATAVFAADVYGSYTAQLLVSDGWTESAGDTVVVSFENVKPVANAGMSQASRVGDLVMLNGSNSSDANGNSLTYGWSIATAPANSLAAIANPAAVTTSFIPDLPGTYVIQLVVNDGYVSSAPGTIQIEVVDKQISATSATATVQTEVSLILPAAFQNPNMQNTLNNKLNAVIANITVGNYALALNQLQNDILKKVDGCATAPRPDKNDWILSCSEQNKVYPVVLDAIAQVESLL